MRINHSNRINFGNLSLFSSPLSMFCNSNATIPTLIIESGVTAGRTFEANKKGGKIEASERFVEQGTSALIWIYGVKLLQKMGEKLGKKILKRDDFNFDVGFDYLRNPLESLDKNAIKFKTINLLSSAAVATLFIGFGLPKINHFITKKMLKKENKKKQKEHIKVIGFEEFRKNSKDISFTSNLYKLANIFENNSTFRLLVTDIGVVGGRYHNARNKYEKKECLFRDIASIYFYLFSTSHIVKLLNKLTSNTDIDPKVLEATVDMLKERLKKSNLTDSHNFLSKTLGSGRLGDLRKIDELFKGRKIITLDEFKKEFFEFASKAEAMSGLQPELNGVRILNKTQAKDVVKGGWVSNPEFLHDVMNRVTKGAYKDKKRYISAKKVEKIRQSINEFILQLQKSAEKKNCTVDSSFVENLAKNSIRKSCAFYSIATAISIYALGFLIPKIQYMIRRKLTNNDEFVGIKDYK